MSILPNILPSAEKEKELSNSSFDRVSYHEDGAPSIDYRNCLWQKAAGLLFSEYICLAIMSFPWSYSVLGLVPGLILTAFVSLTVLYTGLTITEYCIAYPHLTSVCDIGQHLFGGYRWVWYATAVCFILNNTLIQALHVLIGAKYFNTVTDNSNSHVCLIVYSVVTLVICFLVSLPRTFSHMSSVGYFSAATMFIAVVLAMAFAGVSHSADGASWHVVPPRGTTYVSGMEALLNIVYTFVGQITYPSFISQMREPRDFKKALYIVTLAELITFALAGSIIYVYVGDGVLAPAFGSLTGNYRKIAFSFALPTIIFLGSLYSNVSSQFVFLRIFDENSVNRNSHTVVGWATWAALNLFLWVVAFVLAQVIPFFSDLLSLMSSLFDCWFGFVFWGVAFFRLKQHHDPGFRFWPYFKLASLLVKAEMVINIFLILIGFYILGPGTYATIDSIVLNYQSGAYGSPFSCTSNGFS